MTVERSGRAETLPYSLSRWTDLPRAKWDWFTQQLDQGWMVGIDPRTAAPSKWSLDPEKTFGLVFWTKDPTNLILAKDRLAPYKKVVHLTLTGWTEVEKGAPTLEEGVELMQRSVDAFGPSNVVWRFSPVPTVEDVVERFAKIAEKAYAAGLRQVFLSFLQENDLVPETRSPRVRREVLKMLAGSAPIGLRLSLCNEDRDTLTGNERQGAVINSAVCESGWRFDESAYAAAGEWRLVTQGPPTEGCGCALAVDPFTINESCTMGCLFCYAADKSLRPKKINTTKKTRLKVLK